MNPILRLVICLVTVFAAEQRVPSVDEISRIDDPVLREVFANSQKQRTEQPPVPPRLERTFTPRPTDRYYGQGEVPIQHPDPLGSGVPQQGNQNSGFQQLVDTGASAFATGANAFYRGAAEVGQAFGIPQTNYQVPLLNQAASLFG